MPDYTYYKFFSSFQVFKFPVLLKSTYIPYNCVDLCKCSFFALFLYNIYLYITYICICIPSSYLLTLK